jgi:hypothetical protein
VIQILRTTIVIIVAAGMLPLIDAVHAGSQVAEFVFAAVLLLFAIGLIAAYLSRS